MTHMGKASKRWFVRCVGWCYRRARMLAPLCLRPDNLMFLSGSWICLWSALETCADCWETGDKCFEYFDGDMTHAEHKNT